MSGNFFKTSKPRLMIVAATFGAALVAGCIDDDSFSSSSGGSTSFTPRAPVSTGSCPNACVSNIDISVVRGIPAACQAACPEVQTASHCVAAGGAYDNYVKNGRAGADAGTLAQLDTQYSQTAGLARQVASQIGCGR